MEDNKFKEKLIEEVNKLKSHVENNQNLSISILSLGKEYLVNYNKTKKIVEKKDVMKNCHLDFEINLVQSKTLPSSNSQIGHPIVGGLRRPGMNPAPKKHMNDLWKCTIGIAVEKDINTIELLTYFLDTHLNEDTFAEACKKSGVNLQRNDIDERTLANAVFYHQGLNIIQNEFK